MASSVIHMVVSNEINKTIKRDNNKLLIGSIAPDISKYLGESKLISHFLDNNTFDIPNIDKFLKKYKNDLKDDFVLGYFIHLYTDYLWYKYLLPEVYKNDYVKKLDGTYVKCVGKMINMYIYNDYTNFNLKLLDEYHIDFSILSKEPPKLDNIIQEIPMEKIKIILDKTLIIIENSKVNKDLVLNIDDIKKFVEMGTTIILEKIKELNIL